MSLIEEARAFRERVSARLRELEPLVQEYEELRQVAHELGIEADESAGSSSATRAPRRTQRRRGGARRTKAHERGPAPAPEPGPSAGDLRDRVLDAVSAAPGQTVADYARALGVAPTALYRPVRELTTAGTIVKRARQLFPS